MAVQTQAREEKFANAWESMNTYGRKMMINAFGSSTGKILLYLIDNCSSIEKNYIGSQKDIADATGFSNVTVSKAIQSLIADNLIIKRQNGVYYVPAAIVFDDKGRIQQIPC